MCSGKHSLGDYIVFIAEGVTKRGYIIGYSDVGYLVKSCDVHYVVREEDITHD